MITSSFNEEPNNHRPADSDTLDGAAVAVAAAFEGPPALAVVDSYDDTSAEAAAEAFEGVCVVDREQDVDEGS